MVEIDVVYQGNLRCLATHCPSGQTLPTDAPLDNQGQGAAFSPTDLVAAALATCVLTTMAIVGRRHGIELAAATAHVTKEMSTAPPRRIAQVAVTINMPAGLTPEQRALLERAAHACPVHKSLHPDVNAPIHFQYPD